MFGQKLIVGAAVVATATAGGLAMTASPAVAKVGPPITVYTKDAPPPGGKAAFHPGTKLLTVCDNEQDPYTAVARLRIARVEKRAAAGYGCRSSRVELPPNTEVSLQVCLSRSATTTGPLVYCSDWKSTRT